MRLKLALAYDGSDYAGWQLQARQPTVQGAVETALFTLLRSQIRLHGAGRTDAGVHALGQIAHCDVPNRDWDWRKRLNSVLPADIRILAAEKVASSFHSRKDALAKTYIYRFWQEPGFTSPELRNYVWQCGPLDLERIQSGLSAFLGEHDFASFQNAGTEVKSTIRTVTEIGIAPAPFVAWLPGHLPMLTLTITGNGFLKQMVRNIAGFIVAVSKGKTGWEDFPAIIARRSRAELPVPTAPAKGLFLAGVHYGK